MISIADSQFAIEVLRFLFSKLGKHSRKETADLLWDVLFARLDASLRLVKKFVKRKQKGKSAKDGVSTSCVLQLAFHIDLASIIVRVRNGERVTGTVLLTKYIPTLFCNIQ